MKENGINLAWWWSRDSDSSVNRTGRSELWSKYDIGPHFGLLVKLKMTILKIRNCTVEGWYRCFRKVTGS